MFSSNPDQYYKVELFDRMGFDAECRQMREIFLDAWTSRGLP